jgi:hypothetical protein
VVATAPVPIACIERHRLLLAFAHAVSEYNRMNSAQALAVMRGDGFRFTEQSAEARARMEELKYAIIAHEEAHGCAPSDGI